MALRSIPLMAEKYMDPSTAAKKTFNLPKDPAGGGIPALGEGMMANVTADVGLALDRELKSVIDLTNSFFFLIEGDEGLWASELLARGDGGRGVVLGSTSPSDGPPPEGSHRG